MNYVAKIRIVLNIGKYEKRAMVNVVDNVSKKIVTVKKNQINTCVTYLNDVHNKQTFKLLAKITSFAQFNFM